MEEYKVFTDGGARGNPGPAAIGVVVFDAAGKQLVKFGKTIGSTTNNVAEYSAVIAALEWVKQKDTTVEVHCFLDSELVARQLEGRYKVKNAKLIPLFFQVRQLVLALGGRVSFTHVARAYNHHADCLVNEALDGTSP